MTSEKWTCSDVTVTGVGVGPSTDSRHRSASRRTSSATGSSGTPNWAMSWITTADSSWRALTCNVTCARAKPGTVSSMAARS